MASLDTLKSEAEEGATFRGHVMIWEKPYHGERNSLQTANCKHCPAWVQIDTKPMPNGIDIGGPAVAIDCNRTT
jgi:hypothetical protein